MPNFIVRVVLHKATEGSDAYNDLHERMAEKNYFRTITSGGTKYHLPPATYSAKGASWTTVTIRDEVRGIANATGYTNSVFVTEDAGSAWVGLAIVT